MKQPKQTKKKKRPVWFHRLLWQVARVVLTPLYRKYGFRAERVKLPDGPCLIFSTHQTHLDPLLLVKPFRRQMYYVASEHLLRRWYRWILTLAADPIIRCKSRTETNAAMDILRRVREGHSVCVFIEGERCYAGQTEYIPDSAARLAKMAGVPLLTYRLEQGYFIQPRWARSMRKGSAFTGRAAHLYTADELKAMSNEEVLAHIRTDLFVDAYAEQQAQMLAYPGEHLAEHLETLLYRCPVCGSIDTLHSEDDCFFCECGLNLRYTEYGYLEPYHAGAMDAPFATLQAWYEWEKASLTPLAEESLAQPDKPLLCDAHQNMRRCDEDTHYILQQWQNGTLTLYADRLVFAAADGEALVFPFEQIRNISCQERQMLSFSSGGAVYEVLCEQPRSALKYQHLFHALRRFQKAAAD